MYWMHWKSEKNRNEPNELNELKYSKSLNQLCSLTCSCICMLRHVSKHLFIPFKIKKKDWAKWAKWARILKNTLTDEQLCSLTCFFVFACSDKYQNNYLSYLKLKRKKNWAKWAKWARILKNTLTDEQLCSLTCFLVFACSDKYQNIYSFFRFEIRKKNWAKWAKWARILKSTLTNEQLHSFLYLHAQTNINTLLYWSYLKSKKIKKNSIRIFRKKIFKKS